MARIGSFSPGRSFVAVLAAVVSVATLTAGIAVASAASGPIVERRARTVNPHPGLTGYTRPMLNGIAGNGVADGSVASTLGINSPSISVTWLQDNCTWVGALQEEYKGWNKPLILAVGGLPRNQNVEGAQPEFSWKEAAVPGGKGEEYWNRCFDLILDAWAPRDPALLTYSFAHEPNQNPTNPWYAHHVDRGEEGSFLAAEKLFYNLAKKRSPGSKVTVVLNGDASPEDYARLMPSGDYIDYVGTTQYAIHWPQFSLQNAMDAGKKRGKPILVQEWGSKRVDGDGTPFTYAITDQMIANAGTQPGQVAIAVLFNHDVNGLDQYGVTANDGPWISPFAEPATVTAVADRLRVLQTL